MAKSKSFFGLRKGSTKTMTFSVLRGQQITKDRVTDIANPKTMDQTLQRIPFAQAVKFYKQATKGLFRFAFEDKKPLESDYNAFMRHNVKYASSVSLDNYKNSFVPAIGNWLLADGSIPTPAQTVSGTEVRLHLIAQAGEAPTTVAGLTSRLVGEGSPILEGDIITFVAFNSAFVGSLVDDNIEPSMKLTQFVVDANDATSLQSLGLEVVGTSNNYLAFDAMEDGYCCFGAVIVSRSVPSGLKVSRSQIVPNTPWTSAMDEKEYASAKSGDAYSWGAAEKAILQGSLSD